MEYVLDFVEKGSMTDIDIVEDITSLTREEIRGCSETIII